MQLTRYFSTSIARQYPLRRVKSVSSLDSLLSRDPPSEHYDLSSFVEYASRVKLDASTTTYVGTHYEYTVLECLRRLGFSLTRTGGRLDNGIDLLGTWSLPSLPAAYPLKVLIQCKALNRKPSPNVVRELEGAFNGAPAGWRSDMLPGSDSASTSKVSREANNIDGDSASQRNIMALLAAPKEATAGVRDAMGRSRWPMGFLKIGLHGTVEQLLWNKSASDRGLSGLGVTLRHRILEAVETDKIAKDGGQTNGMESEVILTWKGDIWEHKLSPSLVNAAENEAHHPLTHIETTNG